jgi:hypothetical protein
MAKSMTNNASPALGKQGGSVPGGGTKVTSPTRDHGIPKGMNPGPVSEGFVDHAPTAKIGIAVGFPKLAGYGIGNNDKNKAK